MNQELLDQLYDPQAFEAHGKRFIEVLTAHLERTTKGHTERVIAWNTPEKELEFWQSFLKEGDSNDFLDEILARTIHTHHPRYVGHQVAATAPLTALTSMVSGLLNNGMAVYEMGMAPSAIERVVIDSICARIGYSEDSGGFLTSGGTLANLTAMLSARRAKASGDVWNQGHQGALGIMVCEEAHYCIDRAAKIMGLGEQGIIKIPGKKDHSMDVATLETYFQEATAKGIEIFAIVGSAPSTATGAYDDLEAIAEFAKTHNLWFHVDGAHGGAAIYSKKYAPLVSGIEKADSVVIDGHKMLLLPTITTALLFKNKRDAQHTFSQTADYLLDDSLEEQWFNSGKKTFECTKTMMSLHWYLLLKVYGEAVFDSFVTRQFDLGKAFATELKNHPGFEIATPPQSNIVCFRWTHRDLNQSELDGINAEIRQILLEEGRFYLVQTKLRGILYLRISLMNPFTTMEHLRALLQELESKAQKLAVGLVN
ncbi:aminotransferase class V-fold PLP-dependent enzyme [Flagellimonas sp. DF-77]|uniref:pyridoxal phosphate-dependent decarboxylase family protein n=1 Tax=Flagellimonas algarum TaxID=3230298 RepID=UPI00339A9A05